MQIAKHFAVARRLIERTCDVDLGFGSTWFRFYFVRKMGEETTNARRSVTVHCYPTGVLAHSSIVGTRVARRWPAGRIYLGLGSTASAWSVSTTGRCCSFCGGNNMCRFWRVVVVYANWKSQSSTIPEIQSSFRVACDPSTKKIYFKVSKN
jgi:hypothetical protein